MVGVFRGSGLARDRNAEIGEGRGRRALRADLPHALADDLKVLLRDLGLQDHLRLRRLARDHAVVVRHLLEEMRPVARAAVRDHRAVRRKLDRREHIVALADRRLNRQAVVPGGAVVALRVLDRVGHDADALRQLAAGRLAQREELRVGAHLPDREHAAHVEEIAVAGVADRAVHVDLAVHAEAPRLIVRRVVVVGAVAVDRRVVVGDHALLERRKRHERLEARARRENAVEPAVEQRLRLVRVERRQVFVVGNVAVEVERRVGRAGQHRAGVHVERDRRARHAVLPQPGRDLLGERLVGGALQVAVDREPDGIAGLRRVRHGRGDDRAGRIGLDGLLAVLPAQRRFENRLDAALPDRIRIGIAGNVRGGIRVARRLRLGVLLLGNRAERADDVRRERAVLAVVARLAHLRLDAGHIGRALADDLHRLDRDVLRDHVRVCPAERAALHVVADGGDAPHVGLVRRVVDLVPLDERRHARGRVRIRRQVEHVRRLHRLDLALARRIKRVFPARADHDRQAVDPRDVDRLEQLDDREDRLVARLRVLRQPAVHDVVDRPVPGQHLAVAVEDLAARAGQLDEAARHHGLLGVRRAFQKLPLAEAADVNEKDHGHQRAAHDVAPPFFEHSAASLSCAVTCSVPVFFRFSLSAGRKSAGSDTAGRSRPGSSEACKSKSAGTR